MKKESSKGTEEMSKPKKEEGEKKEGGAKKRPDTKGLTLSSIHTEINDDGTHSHTHGYKDKRGMPHHVTHTYTTADREGYHDHVDEHAFPGEGGGAAEPAGEQGEGSEGDEQDVTGEAASPQASAGGAGAAEEEE